jgi:hypothetical protein
MTSKYIMIFGPIEIDVVVEVGKGSDDNNPDIFYKSLIF